MTGSGTREETQHTVSCQRSGTPHPVKADQRAAAKDPRIRNQEFSDLWSRKENYGFAPIFPDTCYHLTHYWPAAVDIPVASDNPVHYADAIRYNARTPLQGSLLPLTHLV